MGCPVTSMMMINAGRVNRKFTQLEITLDKGKRYLGMYTFLIKEPLSMMDDMAKLVLSTEKRKMVENTIAVTLIISNGFKMLHTTPNTERRYFFLISRMTNSWIRNLYCNNSEMKFPIDSSSIS